MCSAQVSNTANNQRKLNGSEEEVVLVESESINVSFLDSTSIEITIKEHKDDNFNVNVNVNAIHSSLESLQQSLDTLKTISIHLESSLKSNSNHPRIPVTLLTSLCQSCPRLESLECDPAVVGTPDEFQEWADQLQTKHQSMKTILLQQTTSQSKDCPKKWEPVLDTLLSSPGLERFQLNWKGNNKSSLSLPVSRRILNYMEQHPNKHIHVELPLSFESIAEATHYYALTRQTTLFRMKSPVNPRSFLGQFFQSHNIPTMPECELLVQPTNATKKPAQTIHVHVSKQLIANPHQLHALLQQQVTSAKVHPPLIRQFELFCNPNYLKAQHLYSQLPEPLWEIQPKVMSNSIQYQQMVLMLQEQGCLFGKDSLSVLYAWFSCQPNHLVQIFA